MRKIATVAFIVTILNLSANAQAQPAVNPSPVVVTTWIFEMLPPGDTLFKNYSFDSLMNYYVDKGIRPNPMIKNFRVLRHWWGDDSFKLLFIYEMADMNSMDKAEDKTAELIDASFKNEAEKKLFWQRFGRIFNRHEDSIMQDWVKPKT